jgi:N utilization substance protein B
MSRRHTGRKLAMQILYQFDMRPTDIEVILLDFKKDKTYEKETMDFALELAAGAWEHVAESDVLISEYAKGWEIGRINLLDKSLLRLAFFEILKTKTPESVIINEVLELSKSFSTDESPKFINGILGGYIKESCLPD